MGEEYPKGHSRRSGQPHPEKGLGQGEGEAALVLFHGRFGVGLGGGVARRRGLTGQGGRGLLHPGLTPTARGLGRGGVVDDGI